MPVLLRRILHRHLPCSRPSKTLNVFQRVCILFFQGLRSRICPRLLRLVTNVNAGQAPCIPIGQHSSLSPFPSAQKFLQLRVSFSDENCLS